MARDTCGTGFTGGLDWPAIGRLLALGRRKLKPTGVAFVMTNPDGLQGALAAMARAGFADVRTITWDRQWPGLGTGLRHQTEFVLLGRLPGSRPVSGVDLISVKAVGPGTTDRYPTEKPVDLGRELARIAGVHRGDLVVDPFCGSGALLLGALERGATVIGGDIATRAVRKATERLTAATVAPTAIPATPEPRGRPAGPATPRRPTQTRAGPRGKTSRGPTSKPKPRPARPAPPRPKLHRRRTR